MNQIQQLRDRLWWAITLELSEKSILQAEIALQEAILLAETRKEITCGQI